MLPLISYQVPLFISMLVVSNIFMTFAWYGHLKGVHTLHWFAAVLISWGLAFFEYLIMVPANRMGYQVFSVVQLKVIQEIITLSVFVPFAILFMGEKLRLNHLWAFLCLVGAVYFAFRK